MTDPPDGHDDAAGDDAPADDPPLSRREKRFEVFATVVLSLAALATAWSGYQAALWDGIQSSDYSQASAARIESAQARTEADQLRIADLTVFENYVDATIDGDVPLAAFYRDRFRDEFAPAFDAWLALDPFTDPSAPASPLAMPEYDLEADRQAVELAERADTLFRDGEEANSFSDYYTMSTLLFAIGLFFAAISERFDYVRMRIVLLALATAGLVTGVAVALSQPITFG